jgi:hypothetical protein
MKRYRTIKKAFSQIDKKCQSQKLSDFLDWFFREEKNYRSSICQIRFYPKRPKRSWDGAAIYLNVGSYFRYYAFTNGAVNHEGEWMWALSSPVEPNQMTQNSHTILLRQNLRNVPVKDHHNIFIC